MTFSVSAVAVERHGVCEALPGLQGTHGECRPRVEGHRPLQLAGLAEGGGDGRDGKYPCHGPQALGAGDGGHRGAQRDRHGGRGGDWRLGTRLGTSHHQGDTSSNLRNTFRYQFSY